MLQQMCLYAIITAALESSPINGHITSKIDAADAAFGTQVAIDGETMAVSSTRAVYLYRQLEDEWAHEHTWQLEQDGDAVRGIALSGDRCAVIIDSHLDGGEVLLAGSIQVLRRTDQWKEEALLRAPGRDRFLQARVAIEEDVCIVVDGTWAWVVYVFGRSDDEWRLESTNELDHGVRASASVELIDGRILIGCVTGPFRAPQRSWIHVLTRDGTGWVANEIDVAPKEAAPVMWGPRLLRTRTRLVLLGYVYGEEVAAFVLRQNNNEDWEIEGVLRPPEPEGVMFGHSAAAAENFIVIGVPPLRAHVFGRHGDRWFHVRQIDNLPGAAFQMESMAIHGDLLVVGCPLDNDGQGSVRLLSLRKMWDQRYRLSTGEIVLDLGHEDVRRLLHRIASEYRELDQEDEEGRERLRRDRDLLHKHRRTLGPVPPLPAG